MSDIYEAAGWGPEAGQNPAETILSNLNSVQREAVCYGEGPLLILAGAGSGKTRVITRRIAWLVENGVHPAEILAITFTNKAANEMKERLASLLGVIAHRMWVGTFHSMMLRILRRHAECLGFTESFTILDTDDQQTLLRRLMKEANIDEKAISVRQAQNTISGWKSKLEDPDTALAKCGQDFFRKRIAELYASYQRALKEQNSMDFDDILMQAVKLLEQEPDILQGYQNRFRHILVDEYQDTNHAQYRLVHMLAKGHGNLCVVGDDDQSIYSFRGANLQNILDFEKDFKSCKVIKLEQNYRSTASILGAANAVIRQNEARKDKKLWTDRGAGEKLTFYLANDQYDEARWTAREIRRLMTRHDQPVKGGEIAVLYRINALSRNMEFALREEGILYRIYGGLRFYDRKEIRDTLAYLRLVDSPDDRLALMRVINTPRRGIGQVTIDRVQEIAAREGLTPFAVMEQAEAYPELSHAAQRLRGFTETIRGLQKELSDKSMRYADYVARVQAESGLERELEEQKAKGGTEAETRLENLRELRSDALEFENRLLEEIHQLAGIAAEHGDSELMQELLSEGEIRCAGEERDLAALNRAFLERSTLYSDLDAEDNAESVSLMSIHSAKGLEFDAVFLIGAEEGVFPGFQALNSPEDMEEERRLAYVAITRARKRLMITATRSRLLYGFTKYNPVSRFLKEIPDELIDELGGSRHGEGELNGLGGDRFDPFDGPWGRGREREVYGGTVYGRGSGGGAGRSSGSGSSEPSFFGRHKENRFAVPRREPEKKAESTGGSDVLKNIGAGTKVRHKRFGDGRVIKTEKVGGDAILSIDFGGTVKHMMASMAKLEIIE